MVVAARGGRSGVRECIRTCLALLLPSLSLLFLPSSPLSHLSLFWFLCKKATFSKFHEVSLFFRLFVQIWCNLPFVYVLKIDYYFFVENHRFSKIPMIRKSIHFPWKTMILPMSRARPNDKFGRRWSQHCIHFSTFWREVMKILEALHLSIVWPFAYFKAKRWKM